MDVPLSGKNIIQLVKEYTGKVPNVLTYKDINNYSNIDDLLINDMCVILYEQMPGIGHWTCIFKEGNEIEHFDSYGYPPDDELNFNNEDINILLGQGAPVLCKLLAISPYDIRYNNFKYQGKDSSTCGRWCILRLIFKKYDEYKFKKIMKDMDDEAIIKLIK